MSINSETINALEIQERIIAKAMEDSAYKQRLLNNPKAVLQEELGEQLPANLTIEVLQQTPKELYLVLPVDIDQFVDDEAIAEEELEAVAGGFIFTAVVAASPYAVKQSPKVSRAISKIFK
ncbi:NHLP leader peptide family natural product precursor [Nostoc sp. FACHB-87]|uniref:NHLP leader peptide family RiPP precursor n=1 Tax=Nostocales TaxID=1161 RepID=UPI001689543A|nr:MULTISPECIES: NHLP leader peptide family RiPP precursor [Nostocales]MBD2299665.1 NHLP leader peptide family natural product precursor [Nostoc sp. FACHB-190]MBD2457487.1 NHLP leader peptide family natural product precursor [Nostoc sp. FACHB-87]MBD2477545.1 NHLP leader peptide family natural product precursor [Anabaena sp. FACHB-83]MBD2489572.1 NHLP leader peptide family natural product precursor [Aulosira sp. FACHB-615]